MLQLGLTGGIGSGKSTVAAMFVELGATLVDTDAISRGLTAAGGAAMPAIATAFGSDAIAADGSLDRDRMRALAFGDVHAKARLEGILHPMIGAQAAREAAAAASGGVVVFDIPLLAESTTWRARVARVVVVDCREATQVERVSRRPGWSVDAAMRVVSQQASRERRRAIADAVIHNDGIALDALRAHVHALWARWAEHAD
jgi:dephospho-CoA kinase